MLIGSLDAPRRQPGRDSAEDVTEVTSAPRGFAGDTNVLQRRTLSPAREDFAGSTSLAVQDDASSIDEALAEFDRRVALLHAESSIDVRFALADFADQEGERPIARQIAAEFETLAEALRLSGPMPADVAEECVRGALAALRAAHDRRWCHDTLSLDAFALDESGVVRLIDVGRIQRDAWFSACEELDLAAYSQDPRDRFDRLWNESFLDGAAEDFRALTTQAIDPLLQAIDGERPAWANRLSERLDAIDGTICSLEDVDHAWIVIDAAFDAFDGDDAAEVPSPVVDPVEQRPVAETPIDETPQDAALPSRSPDPEVTSRVMMLWLCVVGGLAALAGTLAAVIAF